MLSRDHETVTKKKQILLSSGHEIVTEERKQRYNLAILLVS